MASDFRFPFPVVAAGETTSGGLSESVSAVEWTAEGVVMFGVGWVACGLAAAWVLWRRGHEFVPNAVVGGVLGPLFVFLAYDAVRYREPRQVLELVPPTGADCLLVAVAGEVSDADLVRVRAFVDDYLGDGAVVVGAVVPFESVEHFLDRGPDAVPASLVRLAESLAGLEPGQLLLPGLAEEAIVLGGGVGAARVLVCGSKAGGLVARLEARLSIPVVDLEPVSAT